MALPTIAELKRKMESKLATVERAADKYRTALAKLYDDDGRPIYAPEKHEAMVRGVEVSDLATAQEELAELRELSAQTLASLDDLRLVAENPNPYTGALMLDGADWLGKLVREDCEGMPTDQLADLIRAAVLRDKSGAQTATVLALFRRYGERRYAQELDRAQAGAAQVDANGLTSGAQPPGFQPQPLGNLRAALDLLPAPESDGPQLDEIEALAERVIGIQGEAVRIFDGIPQATMNSHQRQMRRQYNAMI